MGRLGLAVGRVLRLAGEAGVVVSLLGRELQDGDGRHPLGVLHLLGLLRDALGDDGAGAVEPGDLEASILGSHYKDSHEALVTIDIDFMFVLITSHFRDTLI